MIELHPTSLPCYRCSATTWEYVETHETFVRGRVIREDAVECCFCGVRLRVDAVAVPVAAPRRSDVAEFRFRFGRFRGLTFAETDREMNGRAYLEHLRDTNERLRERIEEYLVHAAPSA